MNFSNFHSKILKFSLAGKADPIHQNSIHQFFLTPIYQNFPPSKFALCGIVSENFKVQNLENVSFYLTFCKTFQGYSIVAITLHL